jgi:hypothetical protein
MPDRGFTGRQLKKHLVPTIAPGAMARCFFTPFSLESCPQNESFMVAQFFTLADSPLALSRELVQVYQTEKIGVSGKIPD